MNRILAENDNGDTGVCFIDLAQATAGDDWGFVHRLLSVLDRPEKPEDPRHLVLLDAVEGFETLVGDLNAFGEKSTRRARIAQVMRLAAKKCHLLFVVEEAKHERLPEEFVTDVVVRLRNIEISGYLRRTVEVEKTRGQTHIRGQHPFVTRGGEGSTTGSSDNVNYDDPRIKQDNKPDHVCDLYPGKAGSPGSAKTRKQGDSAAQKQEEKYQSYVQVFTSLNRLSREVMETHGRPRMDVPIGKYAGFGIPYLDTMLAGDDDGDTHTGADLRGLPCSSVTALIGDALTQKSQLGRAFLSRAFYPFAKAFAEKVKSKCPRSGTKAEFKKAVESAFNELNKIPLRLQTGGAVAEEYPYFAVDDFQDAQDLIGRLKESQNPSSKSPDPVSQLLLERLSPNTLGILKRYKPNDEKLPEKLLNSLKDDLNALLTKESLHDELVNRAGVRLSGATTRQIKKLGVSPVGERLAWLNRLLLEDAYLEALAIEKVPGVAVLMTTQDTHNEVLAAEFMQWLNAKSLLGMHDSHQQDVVTYFEQKLQEYIKDNTICRRMEIHDLSAPVLAHIFQRNIEAAQRKLFDKDADDELPKVRGRFSNSWRIRMVIDDFNAFRNTFPDMHTDPLLLPFLLFHLRREGISTLILDTQSGKPDVALSERFESSLREVADYRLYTWRIPFYGETRIAITAIPTLSLKNRGLIRELRSGQGVGGYEDRLDRQLTVDPHFELYAGLERGQPHPVPLEVRLYPGTKALIKYIEDENTFFKELFTPVAGKTDVIVNFNPPSYEAFREFCYLQRDTRLDHTLVFQVDEFWLTWLTRQSKTRKAGVLQHQWAYLDAQTIDENGEPARAEDAYHLFQKTFKQSQQAKTGKRASLRRDFYDDERLGYGFQERETAQANEIDRVPFFWDFAFMMCRKNLWTEYINGKEELETKKPDKLENVNNSWEGIQKAKGNKGKSAYVSWRSFLEACKEVADYHSAKRSAPVPAFDFNLDDGEAFSCVVLEIWLSEIYETMKKRQPHQARDFAQHLSHKIWDRGKADYRIGLYEWLKGDTLKNGRCMPLKDILRERKKGKITGYSLELYKTWLLLTEVVDFTNLLSTPHNFSFEFKSRQSNPDAVAARHWYQSACDLIDQHHLAENLVAARLPGRFSVRGDWFLAAAGGSRSSRLAHRAMDLLNSRRANIKRLQLGIGLPVRKLVDEPADLKHVRTRLISTDDSTGRLTNVSYEEFLSIAVTNQRRDAKEPLDEFYWLWRSSLYGYARCSKVWQKWLNHMALWWQTIQARHKSDWTDGFQMYDIIGKHDNKTRDIKKISALESWNYFHEMIEILLMELQQVSFGHEHSDEEQTANG
jgi:hypothetical protein